MRAGDRYLGSISDLSKLLEYKPYKNIILCLWHDKHSFPAVIGGADSLKCHHAKVRADKHCVYCGAYVGNIGQEVNFDELNSHVYWAVNQAFNYCDRVIVKSPYYISNEWANKLTGVGTNYKYIFSHSIYNKVTPMSQLTRDDSSSNCEWRYLTIFQKENKRHIIPPEIPNLYCANLCVYDLLLEDCLIVNPDYAELRYNFSKNYLVCNSKIEEMLKSGNISFL